MQIDLNNYSLEDIFKRLKFEEQKEHDVNFIAFARDWVANTSIKGVKNYKTLINSIIKFTGKEELKVSEITYSFLSRYVDFLNNVSSMNYNYL